MLDIQLKGRTAVLYPKGAKALSANVSNPAAAAKLHRHLNETQRASVAAKLANLSNGQKSSSANLPTSPVTQPQAADMLNVSERSVRTAKKVQEEAIPEITEKMSSGEISLNSSALAASLPIRNEISGIR